jgi:DNA-binding transcriptional LysR family regulator
MLKIDFDLRQLEVFCKVVELKSFSRAADAVFLAQASVSERIANLEKSVGTVLLDRMGRQIVPTKAGELLYSHALRILEMKKTARLEIEKFLGLKQGEILLGGSTIPGEYILPQIMGKFYEQYPFISVILTIAGSREIEDMVQNGIIELGVVGSGDFSRDITGQKILNDELVLAVNKNHRWANKKFIPMDDLYKEPFILRETGSGTMKVMEKYLRASSQKGIEELNVVARLGTSTAIKEAIKANFGVSIISARAIVTEVAAGILKTVKIKEMPVMSRPFFLIRDKRRAVSPLCQAMIDFLVKA